MLPPGKYPNSRSYTQYNVINRVGGNVTNTILQPRLNGQEVIVIDEVRYANSDAVPDEPKTRWSGQVFQWCQKKEGALS